MDPCLLPGENGERRPNLTRTLPCYPCRPTAMHTHRFHPAFQIKHHHGLYSSSVTTTLTALRRDLWYTDFHPDWWAEPAHSNTTPTLKMNDFGFFVGGPILLPKLYNGRDKTFFFASY